MAGPTYLFSLMNDMAQLENNISEIYNHLQVVTEKINDVRTQMDQEVGMDSVERLLDQAPTLHQVDTRIDKILRLVFQITSNTFTIQRQAAMRTPTGSLPKKILKFGKFVHPELDKRE